MQSGVGNDALRRAMKQFMSLYLGGSSVWGVKYRAESRKLGLYVCSNSFHFNGAQILSEGT